MGTPTKSVGASQTQENVIATFPVPYLGVERRVSEAEMAPNALWVGENLHLFEGECRQRPSWNLSRDGTVSAPPSNTGAILTAFSARRPHSRTQFLFVGGTKQVQVLGATSWIKLKDWANTNPRTAQVRFAEIAIGTPPQLNVVVCNGVDTPFRVKFPTSGDPAITDVAAINTASSVIWKDVCQAADRIVGIDDTSVTWGESLQIDDPGPAFPELAGKLLTETHDLAVAVRSIGTLNVGVWKERSFWIGQAKGGSTAAFFNWRVLRWVDGPAAPNALCQDSIGNWYWLTKLGRIVMMDAQTFAVSYPGDGIWPITRKQMSPKYADYATAHAVYRPFYDEVWFFYRATGA